MHIANEAAPNVAVAAVVDIGGVEPDARGYVPLDSIFIILLVLVFEGCQRVAKAIESDDPCNQKAMTRALLVGLARHFFDDRRYTPINNGFSIDFVCPHWFIRSVVQG